MTDSIDDLSEALISTYDYLSSLLHLPLIERELYEMVFVNELRQRSDGSVCIKYYDAHDTSGKGQVDVDVLLGALKIIIVALKKHYRRTVAALSHIINRENIISQMIDLCKKYDSGGCALDQVQVSFLLILLEYQNATLRVVEAIAEWRRQLSRPYPFCVFNSTVNYLERIVEDCEAFSSCPLGRSLRLHLNAFPCGSNINFPRMLRSHRLIWRSRIINTGSVLQEGVRGLMPDSVNALPAPYRPFSRPALCPKPLHHALQSEERNTIKNQRHRIDTHTGNSEASIKEMNSRLLVVEDLILKEAAVQKRLAKELYNLADAAHEDNSCCNGKFLLTLSLPGLFLPSEPLEEHYEASALPLDKTQWRDTLLQLLDKEHCIKLASQTRAILKRQKSRFLNGPKPHEMSIESSTPDSLGQSSASCSFSDSGSSHSTDTTSTSLLPQSSASRARRRLVRVKLLSEELLRQTSAQ